MLECEYFVGLRPTPRDLAHGASGRNDGCYMSDGQVKCYDFEAPVPEARQRWWTRRRVASASILLLICICIAAWFTQSCQEYLYKRTGGSWGTGTDEPTRAQIEQVAKITIPGGVSGLHARLEGRPGFQTAWVRFDCRVEEIREFRTNLDWSGDMRRIDSANFSPRGLERPWWKPQSSLGPHMYGYVRSPHFSKEILFASDAPGWIAIYVYAAQQ